MAFTEAIGRLISLCLRTGVSPKAVIKQLKGIKSSTPVRQENGDVVFSVPDAIAKVLEKYLAGGEQLELLSGTKPLAQMGFKLSFGKEEKEEEHHHEAEICPECGGVLIYQEGCYVCRDCGYSKCS
jgi:ribonucleoside-diphosphate reductase alpha chain